MVSGKDDKGEPVFKPHYIANKLSIFKFMAIIKTVGDDGISVAKGMQKGFSGGSVEICEGGDIAAVYLLIRAMIPGGNVGALAGAGVI